MIATALSGAMVVLKPVLIVGGIVLLLRLAAFIVKGVRG